MALLILAACLVLVIGCTDTPKPDMGDYKEVSRETWDRAQAECGWCIGNISVDYPIGKSVTSSFKCAGINSYNITRKSGDLIRLDRDYKTQPKNYGVGDLTVGKYYVVDYSKVDYTKVDVLTSFYSIEKDGLVLKNFGADVKCLLEKGIID
ncbi:hypothetical protein FJZ26_01315 [Candidatus Parvarchaeota archaeon]|nr:hypothetical protein [Candidatus Parvarchaeota archaeon]